MESTQKADGQTEGYVALLGRRDTPTDGVEDYCSFLGEALERRGVALRKVRVAWQEKGWPRALLQLWRESAAWRGRWVLIQYTTMAWSRRGFPFGVLAALAVLQHRGVRCAVVFHEPCRQTGDRWIDLLRGHCQDWVIRRLYHRASQPIFADPLEKVPWLPPGNSKATFIPIGPNIPEAPEESTYKQSRNGHVKTVAVFCLSDPPNRGRELADISVAMQLLASKGLKARVTFLGRGTPEAAEEIEQAFHSTAVEVRNLGLQAPQEITRVLCQADAMLCVRGRLYLRRGSAIAGIACGLPIVAYAGEAENTPIAEAGVQLVPYGDRQALAEALARTFEDGVFSVLRLKSLEARRRYFSWDVIASRLHESLIQRERARE